MSPGVTPRPSFVLMGFCPLMVNDVLTSTDFTELLNIEADKRFLIAFCCGYRRKSRNGWLGSSCKI